MHRLQKKIAVGNGRSIGMLRAYVIILILISPINGSVPLTAVATPPNAREQFGS